MFPHCTHILSIYNHEDYCHIHLDRLPHGKQPIMPILLPRKPAR
jgi:hypothetical protein